MVEFKFFLKYIIIIALRALCYLLFFVPVKKSRCFFMSWGGKHYSCNPRAMHEYFLSQNIKGYDAVWTLEKGVSSAEIPNARIVVLGTIKWFYYLWTSQYIIQNAASKFDFLPVRKKQKVVKTWHGGGAYKRLWPDVPGFCPGYFQKRVRRDWDIDRTVYISSCEQATKFVIQSGLKHTGEIWNTGTPRNDVLFAQDNAMLKEKVRMRYGIKDTQKILIYAPTFRNSDKADVYNLDSEKLCNALKQRFGGEWKILARIHPFMSQSLNLSKVINASDYPDMQDLLVAADAFITDYSSSVWDFSFTNKPGFLYAVDIEEYMCERNFYVDIGKWPYTFASNMDELVANILAYDEKESAIKRKQHHDLMGSYENGTASEQLMKLLELK